MFVKMSVKNFKVILKIGMGWFANLLLFWYVGFPLVDVHFEKPSRKKKPSNMGRKELVSGWKNH